MTSEESVRRFAAAIVVGRVYGPYGPYSSDLAVRPVFMWVAASAADVRAAAAKLHPYLSPSFAERLP